MTKNPIAKQFPELFTGIGKQRDFQLTVPLKLLVRPVAQPVRRISYGLREHTERLIVIRGITGKWYNIKDGRTYTLAFTSSSSAKEESKNGWCLSYR
jgi:hypothetical protein